MKLIFSLFFCLFVTSAMAQDFRSLVIDSVNSNCTQKVSDSDYMRMESVSDGSDDYQVVVVFFKENQAVTVEESRTDAGNLSYKVLRVYCGHSN